MSEKSITLQQSGALQTGKERAVGTPKPRWDCCGHKILESRDEGEYRINELGVQIEDSG
jgi:hypothetical protein